MKYDMIANRIAKLSVPKDKVIEFDANVFKDALVEFKSQRFKDGFKSLNKGMTSIKAMLHTLARYADNDQAEMGLGVGKNARKNIDLAIIKLSEFEEAIKEAGDNLGDA